MKIKKTIKGIIKKFDLFSQQVTFRYNDQPAYESLSGGFVSIVLIVIFIGIFATTLVRTMNKQYINFNQSRQDQESPSFFNTSLQNTFMFALGIETLDVNYGERYFDIYMQFRNYNSTHKTKTNIPLKVCARDKWSQLGFEQVFDKLNLTKWLCPQDGTLLQLQGKFTSQSFKFYKFAAAKCNPALDPSRPCASNAKIQAFLQANQAFNFNYYFINTIINAGNPVYLKRYVQDVNYFPFSTYDGINANLFVSSYEIQTDQSLWPVEEMRTDQGGIVLDSAQMVNYQVRGNQYMKLYLRKSPIAISITRNFRRIDDTLSYIGGLFSTFLAFLGFMNAYNQISYEIDISKSSYYYDKNDPFDSDQFNILTYVVYMIYSLLDKFGVQPQWPKYKRLHRFLEQGRKHLDMRLIIKKILYAQKLGMAVLDEHQRKALLLSEPLTLDQADQIRKDLRFYKNFRKKFFPKGEGNENDKLLRSTNQQFQFSSELNESKEQIMKIHPLQQTIDNANKSSSQQHIRFQNRQNGGKQPPIIRNQEQFNEKDPEMKIFMLQLQTDAERNNHMANKILQKVDIRIKKRYLKNKDKKPRKLYLNSMLANKIQ